MAGPLAAAALVAVPPAVVAVPPADVAVPAPVAGVAAVDAVAALLELELSPPHAAASSASSAAPPASAVRRRMVGLPCMVPPASVGRVARTGSNHEEPRRELP